MKKVVADISIDLDNKWSYLKTHGDPTWQDFPSYLDQVVPHIREILAAHHIPTTIFVVGKDASLSKNHAALRQLVADGHEIGNHSFMHEPWLQRYEPAKIEKEFDQAEEALGQITAKPLRGFRGPGFSLSQDILNLLKQRGYSYDASTFPTFLGPLARMYFFFKSNVSKEDREDRKEMFGSLAAGLRSIRPYRWETQHGPLLEFPVTTMPIFRTPIHFSYIHFLAQYSEFVAVVYFKIAIRLCRLLGIGPSLLLHPTDFLGGDDLQGMEFFPAMKLPGERKRKLVSKLLADYVRVFDVVPMGVRAEQLNSSGQQLPQRRYRVAAYSLISYRKFSDL
jgi:hypothetical protein